MLPQEQGQQEAGEGEGEREGEGGEPSTRQEQAGLVAKQMAVVQYLRVSMLTILSHGYVRPQYIFLMLEKGPSSYLLLSFRMV